jgi:hypothetical protein
MNVPAFADEAIPTSVIDTSARGVTPSRRPAATLQGAATLWFVIAVLGQLLFAIYVVGFYGRAAIQGHPEIWNKVLTPGYVAGDTAGNLELAAHLLCAVIVTLSGALQLVPIVRRRWPRVHRWNGRVFLTCAVVASAAGLLMVWTRPSPGGDLSQNIGISLSAMLIFLCAGLALRHALARQFDVHRRWAMRLFLVVNTGWFFRVGLMLWLIVNRGPVGFDPKTFTGPFLSFLSFADYLLPLAVLELYQRARESGRPVAQFAMAGGIAILALAMAGGIAAAAGILWLPHL